MLWSGIVTRNKDEDPKYITDGINFFTKNDLFKKKGNIYLLQIFVVSIILFFLGSYIFGVQDGIISYLLSLIASTLICNGYNNTENNKQ